MTLLRQALRFAAVGVLGTAVYLVLFAGLRHVLDAQAASLAARLLTALPTSWLNARVTFGSRVHVLRAYAAGLGGLAVGAALSAIALAALQLLVPQHSPATEVVLLGAVQAVAAALRFLLLRRVAAVPALTADVQRARRAGAVPLSTLLLSEGDEIASSPSTRSTHDRPRRSAAAPDLRAVRP